MSAWRVSGVYSSTTRYRESQVLLAVYSCHFWHLPRGVWTCAHTYPLIIATQVFFFMCLIFGVGHDREIILTAKFSRSTVAWNFHGRKLFTNWWILTEKTLLVPLKDAVPPNFLEKTFANNHKTLKSTKVFSLESSQLYGSLVPRPSHRRVLITSVSKTRRWEGLGMRLLQPRSLGLVTDYVPNVALTQWD